MALTPQAYAQRDASDARNAELHVQLEVERIQLPPHTPGDAIVEGRIARVFRGDPAQLSTRVSFQVDCCREGDMLPPSGIRWTRVEDLERAKVIEVHLNSHTGGFTDAGPGVHLLQALTDTPRFAFTHEEDEEEP